VNAPAPPSSLGFDVPDKIDEAIVRALDPDRANRWPDVASFTRELVGALDETTHGFVPPTVTGMTTESISVSGVGEDAPTERPSSEAPTELRSKQPVAGDDPEPTALSDENAPTILKPEHAAAEKTPEPAPVVQERAPGAAVISPLASVEQVVASDKADLSRKERKAAKAAEKARAAEAAREAESAAKAARPPRRKGRWMAAAVVALLVGGAAGFSYQRYVEPRTMGDLHGYGTVQRN
jgi:hypothetical protein